MTRLFSPRDPNGSVPRLLAVSAVSFGSLTLGMKTGLGPGGGFGPTLLLIALVALNMNQAPRPSVPATRTLSAWLYTRSQTRTLGRAVPSLVQTVGWFILAK